MRVSERITSGANFDPLLYFKVWAPGWISFKPNPQKKKKNRRRQLSCTSVFVHTSRRWRTLLGVCGRMRRWSRSARFRSQPLLKVELGKSGSLRAHLPGRIEEVAICTTKGCKVPKRQERKITDKYWSVWNVRLLLTRHETVSVLTKIFKLLFQSHAVMWETLLADESVSTTRGETSTSWSTQKFTYMTQHGWKRSG